MKNFINIPKMEGKSSRQAHADLPNDTFEREMSKEGFFGPSAHIYHEIHQRDGSIGMDRFVLVHLI